MKKPFYIVGNWKMHKTRLEACRFAQQLIEMSLPLENVMIAAPFTLLFELSQTEVLTVGAQDVSEHIEGAYTGDISAKMAKDAGAKFSIVGHSERRQYHHESSEVVGKKLQRCLEEKLKVILCVGETLREREEGATKQKLTQQVLEGLKYMDTLKADQIMIAYEPIWAIGTGHSASLEMIESVHEMIREMLISLFGPIMGGKVPILYGGSVNGSIIESLSHGVHIDGVLIGGASLDPQVFANIIMISRDIKR